jgi:hypothetical protein
MPYRGLGGWYEGDRKQIRLLKYLHTADSERLGEKINYVD